MLSADIRVNRSSIFAKDRPGVYRLVKPRVTSTEGSDDEVPVVERLFDRILPKSGLINEAKIAKGQVCPEFEGGAKVVKVTFGGTALRP